MIDVFCGAQFLEKIIFELMAQSSVIALQG